MPQGHTRQVERAVCPEHAGSRVTADGVRTLPSGRTTRRYLCRPLAGKPHKFSVVLTSDNRAAPWSPPPPCPDHPGSKVVRNGTYGKSTSKPRQRYRCSPDDGSKPHSFTPSLPRDHVHEGDETCAHCEELRGVHHGDTAAARRHSWSTRVVAVGLQKLAEGASYAEVGKWARRVSGSKRRRSVTVAEAAEEVTKKRKPSPASREARNAWHVAADWVEAFGPVIWNEVEERLRVAAIKERKRLDERLLDGLPLDLPQVVFLDDQPVYGRDLDDKRARRDAGYFILVAGETEWLEDNESVTRLRLARAMAKSNTPAWLLVLQELGYTPDYIVADNGKGIVAAVNRYYGDEVVFIPSMWHLIDRIRGALNSVSNAFTVGPAGKELEADIAAHLRQLHRGSAVLTNTQTWSDWWDDFEALMRHKKLPVDAVKKQRVLEEEAMAKVLHHLAAYPHLPISSGGLETLMTKHIKPLLAMRRAGFANLERTNSLMDLAVANHHHAFDDISDVVKLLREDTLGWRGWTRPLRAIADPRAPGDTNSSLRDPTLLYDLARQRKLL